VYFGRTTKSPENAPGGCKGRFVLVSRFQSLFLLCQSWIFGAIASPPGYAYESIIFIKLLAAQVLDDKI